MALRGDAVTAVLASVIGWLVLDRASAVENAVSALVIGLGAGVLAQIGAFAWRFVWSAPKQMHTEALATIRQLEQDRDRLTAEMNTLTQPMAIRARIKILWPQTWGLDAEGAPCITFPVQIVNKEAAPLVLRVEYEEKTPQGTYTAYVVSVNGRSHDSAFAVRPDDPSDITVVITRFMHPVPPQYRDKVQYPSDMETTREHRLVFTDVKTSRKAVVTDRTPYDA